MNVSTKKSNSHFQTGFAFGCLYQRTKEELNSLAREGGGTFTALELAGRMAELFAAETSGGTLGSSQSLHKMRGSSTKGHAVSPTEKVHVRPHARRSLSKKARKAISKAQKARWAEWQARWAEWHAAKAKK